MIVICIGIKNRSFQLLNYLIPSIIECRNSEELALSIYDCGSDDVPNLEEQIKINWKGKFYFTSIFRDFTRSYSINRAVEQSIEEWLFLCDADMTLPNDFVEQYHQNVSSEKTWFPICFSIGRGKPREINEKYGWWQMAGYGMVGISRKNFMDVKGLNEGYVKWGGEDNEFYNKTKQERIRNKCYGLFHNFHESPHLIYTSPERFR